MASPENTTLRVTLQSALAPTVWGSTYLITTELLPPGRPLLAGTLRALPAGLLLLAFARVLPTGGWWWRSFVLGTLNIGAFFALLFVAAYRLPGGVAATLGAVQPVVVGILAVFLLGQRLSPRRLAAGAAAVAGVALLVLRADAAIDPVGVLAGLAATASMGLGVVLTKRWGSPVPLLAFTGWQLTAGGLVLAPLTLLTEGLPAGVSQTNVVGYAYLALVGAALAYALWFRGIGRLSAPAVSFLGLLSPLVAALLGAVVLAETMTLWQVIGFCLALASLLVGQLPDPEPPAHDHVGVRIGGALRCRGARSRRRSAPCTAPHLSSALRPPAGVD